MPIIERLLVPLSVVVAAAGMALLVLAATASSAATAGRAAPTSTADSMPTPTTPITTTTATPVTTSTVTTTTPAATTTTTPVPVATTTTVPPSEPSPVERVVAYARAQLAKPYARGAAGPAAFDCSGLTRAAYLTIGVDLPHYSVTQAARGRPVDWRREAIEAGDLVFMRGDTPVIDLGHVGLAVSPTEWIVAPRTGQPVQLAAIPVARIQRVRRMVDG